MIFQKKHSSYLIFVLIDKYELVIMIKIIVR